MKPVVIVGGGPTGLVAAGLLTRQGVPVVLIEREAQVRPIPRAVHFDDEVMRIFHDAGFGPAVSAISTPMKGLRLVNERHECLAEFVRADTGTHGFAQSYAFDQPELERALWDALSDRAGLQMHVGHAVESVDDLTVTVRSPSGEQWTLEAAAVLGCDGARSAMRKAMGGDLENVGYSSKWMVVDVDTERPLPLYEGCIQVADPVRAQTYVWLGDQRHRWEFQIPEADPPESPEALARQLLAPWLGDRMSEITVRRCAIYQFHALVARRYRRGWWFLLGDAAHQMPPFIGQGMGAGIRDAANLGWKLASVLQERAAPGILDTYQPERRRHVRTVVGRAVFLGRIMELPWGTGLRDQVLKRALSIPSVHRRIAHGAAPAHQRGALVGLPGASRWGGHMPRARVAIPGGTTDLDRAMGPAWGWIYASDAGGWTVQTSDAVLHVGDVDGTLGTWLGPADVALVRPDRVVAAVGRRSWAGRWVRRLARHGVTLPAPRSPTGRTETNQTRSHTKEATP